MQKSVLAAAALAAALWAAPALAGENYLPTGYTYTPDSHTLPAIGSEEAKQVAKYDAYESELHRKQRQIAIDNSFLTWQTGSALAKDPFSPQY